MQQLLWLRLGGKWEAGTEVRDLGRGRLLKDLTCQTLHALHARILWGWFKIIIIIVVIIIAAVDISSVSTLCQAGPELNSSPGLSHLICTRAL